MPEKQAALTVSDSRQAPQAHLSYLFGGMEGEVAASG